MMHLIEVVVIKTFYVGDRYKPIVISEGTKAFLRVVNSSPGIYTIIVNGVEYATDFNGDDVQNFIKVV